MLYSLGALTTYGDTTIHLAHQWKMMGSLEAVNGMLLFGLTTAFLFAMIQRVLLHREPAINSARGGGRRRRAPSLELSLPVRATLPREAFRPSPASGGPSEI